MPFRRRRERTVHDDVPPRRAYEETVVEEEPPPRRPPELWPWLLLLLLLVLAGLGALWYFSRDEDKRTVPDLVGLREDEAVTRLRADDLRPEVDRRPNKRPRGVVFAQTPGGGAQVDEAEVIELEVSTGPPNVVVPQVVNLPQEQAEAQLRDAGLEALVRRVFAEEPPGTVIAQDPRGGERAAEDSQVRINVSKGTGRVAVPDVTGIDRAQAEARLRRAGLKARTFVVPADETEGTVVAQNPPPGEQLAKGDAVRLNVSSGAQAPAATGTTGTGTTATGTAPPPATTAAAPAARPRTVAVPTVVGTQRPQAQRRLQAAGLGVTIDYVPSREREGTVVAQRPTAGATARRGSFVRINVSEGPRPAARAQVPDVVGLDEQTARADLRAAGFRVEVFREPTPDPAEADVVIRQTPAAGRRAPRGSVVTIFVGQITP